MTSSETPPPTIPPYLRAGGYALRALGRADARDAMAWWPQLYPVDAGEAERWLEEILKSRWVEHKVLALVRESGGRPSGSVVVRTWRDLNGDVTLHLNPLLPAAERAAAADAAVRIVVRWLIEELGNLNAVVFAPADLPLEGAAAECHLIRAGAYREALLAPRPGEPGRRLDLVVWEALNQAWSHAWAPPAPPLPNRPAERIDLTPGAPPEALRNPVAIGPRVYLRPLEPADSPVIADWDNTEPETGFDLGRRPASAITLEVRAKERYKQRPPEEIVLGACRIDDGTLIGMVGVDTIDWVHRTGETFSFFAAAARGQGLGTEAKTLLLGYAFERLGLHMVKSGVFSFNPRSAVALLKQGYRHLGTIHDPLIQHGRFHQDWLFDLLARDWLALQRADR